MSWIIVFLPLYIILIALMATISYKASNITKRQYSRNFAILNGFAVYVPELILLTFFASIVYIKLGGFAVFIMYVIPLILNISVAKIAYSKKPPN